MSDARPLRRGDVVLIPFPFSDLSSQKLRPALVLGQSSDGDVIVSFVTSRIGRVPSTFGFSLDVQHAEFPASGLKVPSMFRLDKIATLDRMLIRRRLGQIGPQCGQRVRDCLRRVFAM